MAPGVFCSHCGKPKFSPSDPYCRYCHAPFQAPPPVVHAPYRVPVQQRKRGIGFWLGMLGSVLLGLIAAGLVVSVGYVVFSGSLANSEGGQLVGSWVALLFFTVCAIVLASLSVIWFLHLIRR